MTGTPTARARAYGSMLQTPAPGDAWLLIDRRATRHVEAHHWWLLDADGAAVAYLHTLLHARNQDPFVLCDIEVHPERRRHGHARAVVEAAEAVTGHRLHTSGSFTPTGAAALTWLPLLPGTTAQQTYPAMTFVDDWDTLTARFPL